VFFCLYKYLVLVCYVAIVKKAQLTSTCSERTGIGTGTTYVTIYQQVAIKYDFLVLQVTSTTSTVPVCSMHPKNSLVNSQEVSSNDTKIKYQVDNVFGVKIYLVQRHLKTNIFGAK
jgi:SPX domain protein involved in polyphosphate accumulation